MAEESSFRAVIGFMDKLGVYDVILPFLLVFTIVFAILEKTKILGMQKIGSEEIGKKNLNATVAFVVAFFVVASAQLVSVVSEVMSNVVLLLILAVCFLMLVGVFYGDKEFNFATTHSNWLKFFMVLMFVGIVLIFLNALDWLKYIFELFEHWNAEWALTIFFFLILIGFMVWITWSPTTPKPSGGTGGAAPPTTRP